MIDYILTFIVIVIFIGGCIDVIYMIPSLRNQVAINIITVQKAVLVFITFPFVWLPVVCTFIFIKLLKKIGVL